MPIDYWENTSPEIAEAVRKNTLILLPTGQVEQHGPHLPVGCDTFNAWETARRVAKAIEEEIPVMVMPPVWSTYTVDLQAQWPGMIQINTRAVIDLFRDIMGSLLGMGFRKIVVVNGHGNNPEFIKVAIRELQDKYQASIMMTAVYTMGAKKFNELRKSPPGGSMHAGEYETAVMLAMGHRVDMSKAPKDDIIRYKSEVYTPDMMAGKGNVSWSIWSIQQSRTGVYGDPTVATKELGEEVIKATVEEYKKAIREYYFFEPESGIKPEVW
jgi:creatinine amidohydrolase